MSDKTPQLRRMLWRVLGGTSVAIGLINAFIPLLPTTVFLLVGVWAYGKGSPELQARLLAHPRYGQALRLWHEQRMLTRRGKLFAVGGIVISFMVSATLIGAKPITALIGIGLAALVLYLLTRPEPAPGPRRAPLVA